MPDTPVTDNGKKEAWSHKFIANVLATAALILIYAGSMPAVGIDAEVAKEAMWDLIAISALFNTAKGFQDWQRAKQGK